MTWVHPKSRSGPLAYMVELVRIIGKSYLQKYGEKALDIDEDGEDDSDLDDIDAVKSGQNYPSVKNVKIPKEGLASGDTADVEFEEKSESEKAELYAENMWDEL